MCSGKGDRSRPYQKCLYLSRFSVNCVVNLFSRLVVNLHVVLLTTMLLDFRHDFFFTVCGDLPIAVFSGQRPSSGNSISDCYAVPAQ
jgi:hypothetical protein